MKKQSSVICNMLQISFCLSDEWQSVFEIFATRCKSNECGREMVAGGHKHGNRYLQRVTNPLKCATSNENIVYLQHVANPFWSIR